MRPSDFVLVIFLIPAVTGSLVRFQLPFSDNGLSFGELFEGQTSAASYHVVQIYNPYYSDKPFNKKGVEEFFRMCPCIMLEPAYTNVRNRMVFYGGCKPQSRLFRLELKRSGEARQWTGKMDSCAGKIVTRERISGFDFTWQGINHTVTGLGNEEQDDYYYADVHILFRKSNWRYDKINAMDSAIDAPNYWVASAVHRCACSDESQFNTMEIWHKSCPDSVSFRKAYILLIWAIVLLPLISTRYICYLHF